MLTVHLARLSAIPNLNVASAACPEADSLRLYTIDTHNSPISSQLNQCGPLFPQLSPYFLTTP
jgi:hypothetical protein